MKNEYTPALKDDLAKNYNFIVHFDFPMTAHYVWVAIRQTTGIGSSTAYCEKFVREVEEIKAIAEAQPTTIITYKDLAFDNQKNLVEVGEPKTWEHKTYDKKDMEKAISKVTSYKFHRVSNIERKLHENLEISK